MTQVLDNQTFVLYQLRDGEPRSREEARHMPGFNGKVIQAMPEDSAKKAIFKLKKRGLVERTYGVLPTRYQITTAGLERLQRLGLLEEVDTKALLRSFGGNDHGKA